MFGGGTRRDNGLAAISSPNIFSALETRRRKSSKKRSDKEKGESRTKGSASEKETLPSAPVWTPTPVTVKSWADCEDDDDYFATVAPPPSALGSDQQSGTAPDAPGEDLSLGEESEGDEVIEEAAEGQVGEEVGVETSTLTVDGASSKPPCPSNAATRQPARQLSKKERKKKELAELEAVLTELGLNQKEENDASEPTEDKQQEGLISEANGELENRGGPGFLESKSAKRRKAKKEKCFKEGRDGDVFLLGDADTVTKDDALGEDREDNSGQGDPREVLKKLSSFKKKKSSKDSDLAAKAAAAEAAVRAAKLAAAKKKEKNHYNQQPVR